MKVLVDFHHTDLFRSFIMLFEKRLGGKVFRPSGSDWYDKGYYWHPIPEEARGNLSKGLDFDSGDVTTEQYYSQDNKYCRWLPLSEVQTLTHIVCSSDRNQHRFQKLKKDFGLTCPIIRYIGNVVEDVDDTTFDWILPATLSYHDLYVSSGRKPGFLYHPEFDLNLYSYSKLPTKEDFLAKGFDGVTLPIVRTFLNFLYHDSPGSDKGLWKRYVDYVANLGGTTHLHGLGTPPEGVDTTLNLIIDIWFNQNGRQDLLDRNNWPPLLANRGEPRNDIQIAELMKFSSMIWHVKRCDGYGFIVHKAAAMGRPIICEQRNYAHLSARSFLQDGQTCLYITGHPATDTNNLKQYLFDPEQVNRMSKAIYQRFCDNVNFETEAEKVRALL